MRRRKEKREREREGERKNGKERMKELARERERKRGKEREKEGKRVLARRGRSFAPSADNIYVMDVVYIHVTVLRTDQYGMCIVSTADCISYSSCCDGHSFASQSNAVSLMIMTMMMVVASNQ